MRRKFKRFLQNVDFFLNFSYVISVLLSKVYLIYAMPNHARFFSIPRKCLHFILSIPNKLLLYILLWVFIIFLFMLIVSLIYLLFESEKLTSFTVKNGINIWICKTVLKSRMKINSNFFKYQKIPKSLLLSLKTWDKYFEI